MVMGWSNSRTPFLSRLPPGVTIKDFYISAGRRICAAELAVVEAVARAGAVGEG